MRLYFAGINSREQYFVEGDYNIDNALLSYFYMKNKKPERVNKLLQRFDNVFIDSGGYSARMQNEEINLQNYIDFLKTHEKQITEYANLDTRDPKESHENQLTMEENDLEPIPVIHSNDYKETIDLYKSYDKVAIGGVAGEGLGTDVEFDFLRYCFSHLPESIKVHGFGITSLDHIRMFDWDSVDSTSWLSGSRYGNAYYYNRGELQQIKPEESKEVLGCQLNELHYKKIDKWNLNQWKALARDLQ